MKVVCTISQKVAKMLYETFIKHTHNNVSSAFVTFNLNAKCQNFLHRRHISIHNLTHSFFLC